MNVAEIYNKLIKFLSLRSSDLVMVSSPGRIDFLNTHQDYKGLPVVPAAINLRCYAIGFKNESDIVNFTSLNMFENGLNGFDSFSLSNFNLVGGGWFGDYVRSIFKVLMDSGFRIGGMDIALWSEIPIGSGLSSSAAFEVSIVKLISEVFNLGLDKNSIAEIAYKAEHDVMGIPCGRLDQYSCSYGGMIILYPNPPCKVEFLPSSNFLFVIVDSGIHRRIVSVHPIRQAEINEALRILLDEIKVSEPLKSKLAYRYDKVYWMDISEDELKPYLDSLPRNLANRLIFTIKMNVSTIYAVNLIKGFKINFNYLIRNLSSNADFKFNDTLDILGLIVNYQHMLLRDYYDVSLPEIENIRDLMLDNGAIGVKISGAGLGGAIIGLVKNVKSAEKVCKACIDYGCPLAFYSNPVEGVRIESYVSPMDN
ncbi:MAG: galactokinase family protein [Candidatus Methanomethylicia archaeon]